MIQGTGEVPFASRLPCWKWVRSIGACLAKFAAETGWCLIQRSQILITCTVMCNWENVNYTSEGSVRFLLNPRNEKSLPLSVAQTHHFYYCWRVQDWKLSSSAERPRTMLHFHIRCSDSSHALSTNHRRTHSPMCVVVTSAAGTSFPNRRCKSASLLVGLFCCCIFRRM